MNANLIGHRVKYLREKRSLTQENLADLLGIKDRQTVSAIENGARKVSADELLILIEKLNASLEFFTDPFMLVGEGKFSWRTSEPDLESLESFESKAGCWLAMFRELAMQTNYEFPLLRRRLGLTKSSTYEEAMRAGERFAAEFKLGDVPAARLREVMEKELGILVLMVDTEEGISGVACSLPNLDAVLVSRRESIGRRHFDLAHELFHLLTWDAMPPERLENLARSKKSRTEQLADSFASALLMPTTVLGSEKDWGDLDDAKLITRLNSRAKSLEVSALALKWRLVALKWLKKSQADSLSDLALRNNGCMDMRRKQPPLFSKMFMEVIGLGIESGCVSVRKVASVLDATIDDLVKLFEDYEIDCPFDL